MCPISITGVALDFANRSRAAAHSRTCVMLPAEESTSEVAMVCMESMMTNSGFTSLMQSNMSSSEFSHNTCTLSDCSVDSRSARIFSW